MKLRLQLHQQSGIGLVTSSELMSAHSVLACQNTMLEMATWQHVYS